MTETRKYAELHTHSAFSFLDGASQPEELVAEACRLGLSGLALTDHNGFYGVVRFAQAAGKAGLPSVFGAELSLDQRGPVTGVPDPDADHLIVLARGPEGYHRLSRAIALAHLETEQKGQRDYRAGRAGLEGLAELAGATAVESLAEQAGGHWLMLTGCRKGSVQRALASCPHDGPARALREVQRLQALFGAENVAVEITDHGRPDDAARCDALAEIAARAKAPLVATGGVHCAGPQDQPLADVLAALRARASLEEIDGWLPPHPAHLRSAAEMAARHRRRPHAVDAAHAFADECSFDLALVAPELPRQSTPPGHDELSWLHELVRQGAVERYGPREQERTPGAWATIDHELDLIGRLGFAGYFLIVRSIVDFCERHGILCQGRGSAANSAVCYALGITAVDAVRYKMLFERFLSDGRAGPPDIDLDIESARREEVIQFVYSEYGRKHAAQVANVISYRPRSAVRDAARAFGHDVGQQDAWSKGIDRWGSLRGAPAVPQPPWWSGQHRLEREETGRDDPAPEPRVPVRPEAGGGQAGPGADALEEIPEHVVDMAERMLRLPRHLGIHSGGMVLCDRPVIEVCPVEWARMPGRTVLQWDKDDCADAGLVKFDLLGLGMLTALRLSFEQVAATEGVQLSLHGLPKEDPAVYDLLCAADTIGVFQVESRAQISTLPRLRPRDFYDIVVEVALIRPGPIQGQSVHPFIRRKNGQEKVTYLHDLLVPALERTKGVPLFQEQLMQIAIDVAGFSATEADELRRAMGSKRSAERMEALRGRLMAGMAERGVGEEVAAQIYDKLRVFADFGFPESHAFSFAYLVYASAWLKAHHPEAFYAGLLGAQPMGFYSPASLISDARRHDVVVHRACVLRSGAHALVEQADSASGRRWALRLGLAPLRGIGEALAERIVAERERHVFDDVADLSRRVRLTAAQLEVLATAGALRGFGLSRRQALWSAGPLSAESGVRVGGARGYIQDVLPGTAIGTAVPELPEMTQVEEAVADVWASGLSPDNYPTAFVRERLHGEGVLASADLQRVDTGIRVEVGGVVTHRQRPGTAQGVTFLSLEDETGVLNVVCSPGMWARHRRIALRSAALVVRGTVERADGVVNLLADGMRPLDLRVPTTSRDFQ